ncbi:hypothetical protein SAMN02787144_102963 [Streptomyces atratus]|uniref:Uncharacterized protein n=1 Tax=Streptomyces atratus TaxID=1893 RepID=A0A1K2F4L6_STRAR|nr:hypothetical protein SAMN02787144_102963 [Streptomyces atratus]
MGVMNAMKTASVASERFTVQPALTAVHRAKGDGKRPGPGVGASGIDAERVQTESGEVRVAAADVDL